MCGIVGAITKRKSLPIEEMLTCISHRGPDDSGVHTLHDNDFTVTLGQRRLSIIDLSPAGHQPMATPDQRYWITYNGELYNFPELKKELENCGHSFRSKTDTEVLLASHAQWGEDAVCRFNGMFAYALWDDREKKLLLVRDHAGQKPLYYAHLSDDGIVFASEIKSILASGLVRVAMNPKALPEYLGSLRVHAPQTMFEGILKLPAAHKLVWHNGSTRIEQWWDPLDSQRTFIGSRSEAVDTLHSLFRSAVKRHMIADVPVGAFLSGGLDSSVIVSHAIEHTRSPLTTFTTGFSDSDTAGEASGKNELTYARMLREKLGSALNYNEIILKPNVHDLLPHVIWHLDEPIADPATLNAYLICAEAKKQGITVLLSGMGADEIFGGYNHHLMAWHARHLDHVGSLGRSIIASTVSSASHLSVQALTAHLRYLQRKGRFLSLASEERTIGLMSWLTEQEVATLCSPDISPSGYLDAKKEAFRAHSDTNLLNRILYSDTKTFLSEHNLMYTDKMSMASSCEVRSPFLDREIMEFAFSLPPEYKIHGTSGKDIVKRMALKSLPRTIVTQRKSGFAAPIRAWKSELQTLASELLSPQADCMRYFRVDGVQTLIKDHAAGKDVSYQIWSLISFALWHRIFIEKKTGVL